MKDGNDVLAYNEIDHGTIAVWSGNYCPFLVRLHNIATLCPAKKDQALKGLERRSALVLSNQGLLS
jgi:hypothetical protein